MRKLLPLLIAFAWGTLLREMPAGAWEHGANFRRLKLDPQTGGKTGFTLLSPAETGVLFSNVLSLERVYTNTILANGSGVALGDVDGDGWCDIYLAGLDGSNALYRNLGQWKFEDITVQAGVACENLFCTGVALSDVDGDGDLDLLVNAVFRGTSLFLNDGGGHFSEATKEFGLQSDSGATSLALGDVDGDSDLDLYVANYRSYTVRDEPDIRLVAKRTSQNSLLIEVDGVPATNATMAARFSYDPLEGVVENGEADVLYLNEKGVFRAVPWTDGAFLDELGRRVPTPYDWGLSVMIRDLNHDGAPDIYVCNDFLSPDRIWINQGNGKFKALPSTALRDTSGSSMGADVADINRDGLDDIFVLDMLERTRRRRLNQIAPKKREAESLDWRARVQHDRNTLLLNRGDDTYAEIAFLAGLHASDWSWNPIFLDVDLDGFEDVLISNGFVYDGQHIDVGNQTQIIRAREKLSGRERLRLRRLFPKLDAVNCAFRNRGDLTFEDRAEEWNFKLKGISQGMALADLDRDGDLDVVLNNLNAAASLYRNESPASRLAVRLKGAGKNTYGIGTRIHVLGGPVPQSQEVIAAGRYLSCDEAMRTFAGFQTNRLRIEVHWRCGKHTTVEQAEPGWLYEILEPTGGVTNAEPRKSTHSSIHPSHNPIKKPLFVDVSASLPHSHQDSSSADFDVQPLLSRRLGQLGPGVAVLGNSAFAIGAGQGGKIALFTPRPNVGFQKIEVPSDAGLPADSQGMVCLPAGLEARRLIVALSSWELSRSATLLEIIADKNSVSVRTNFPAFSSSIGPLAAADIDGDGTLELFVGGRANPARYPEPCSSFILRERNGTWTLDPKASEPLEKIGMVSGAIFSDLNGDGWLDLALACDWGPVRVLLNQKGAFIDRTKELGLAEFRGWWNGITAGDFDGDGQMDLVASNWGRNNKYHQYLSHELRIYFGAWQMPARLDLLEAYFDPEEAKVDPWPNYERALHALPFLASRFPTAASYAGASIQEILGAQISMTQELRVNTLDSMVFLNRSHRFEPRSLPIEAQFAPAFGLTTADFDGDAAEDIFLAQNFFHTDAETGRHTSGRGLLLRGDGKGGFTALPGQESGLILYGDQRGCARGDFNADGRPDLFVAQNNGPVKLFLNQSAKPGLRVQLTGGAQNPGAIGAGLRAFYKTSHGLRPGPAREIHAGSGYWSQDAPTQIFGNREQIEAIWVRWPDHRTNLFSIATSATEVVLKPSGER